MADLYGKKSVKNLTMKHLALKDNKLFVKGNKNIGFVAFYAPWCPHCQNMVADWEALAKTLAPLKVNLFAFNCEAPGNREIHLPQCAKAIQIQHYPTLKFVDSNGLITDAVLNGREINADDVPLFLLSKIPKSKRGNLF